MKKAFYLLLGIILLGGVYACSDDTTGASITDTQLDIVADSSFTVQGVTVANNKVQSRTMTQLLGSIKATNYGELKSDIVSQFMPAEEMDTAGVNDSYIDSLKLILRFPIGAFIGDSVTPMRVNVYKLNKQLPSPIYSDFDPSGYYSKSDLLGSTSYTTSSFGVPDSILETQDYYAYRQIEVPIKRSLALDMYHEYINNPSTYATPENFAKFFPGVYVTTSYGSGRVTQITKNAFKLYYRFHYQLTDTTDTIYNTSASYAGSAPEVVTNNNITMNVSSNIKDMVNSGEAIIQAPAAYDVAIKFPIQDIIDRYKSEGNSLNVINNVYFELPADSLPSEYKIAPPMYLLLVRTCDKDEFFAKNKIADNITSFYATYNSKTKKYAFSEMRSYMMNIINDQNGIATDDDINMTITPIDVTTETSSSSYYSSATTTITGMAPAVITPSIAKLDFKNAKIKLIYSKQLLRN